MFPEIRLSDSIQLPTYLVYLSLLYCFLIFYVLRRSQKLAMDTSVALDLALIMMLAGFVGSRMLHVLYEAPLYYAEDATRLFKFWEGGFVFFGGFLLAAIACWIFLSWKKLSFLEWADFFAPVLALGYGLGRISCFLAGCCYGRACEAPWAVRFPWDREAIARHPTQLYAVFWELAVFAFLVGALPRLKKSQRRGSLFFFWLGLHAIGRLMMEYFRDDFRGAFYAGLGISSWLSLGFFSFSLAWLLVHFRKDRRFE